MVLSRKKIEDKTYRRHQARFQETERMKRAETSTEEKPTRCARLGLIGFRWKRTKHRLPSNLVLTQVYLGIHAHPPIRLVPQQICLGRSQAARPGFEVVMASTEGRVLRVEWLAYKARYHVWVG